MARNWGRVAESRGQTAQNRAKQVGKLPRASIERIPSDVFVWSAGLSVLASATLRIMGRKNDALFVGEWAPTFLLLGILGRLHSRSFESI